jgi:hypothetical protein
MRVFNMLGLIFEEILILIELLRIIFLLILKECIVTGGLPATSPAQIHHSRS